jgi:WD40 repeat protein
MDVWDLNTGELVQTLEGHIRMVTSIAVTSDNSKIVSGSLDNTICLWDLNTGNLTERFTFYHPVASIAITFDNAKILYASSYFAIHVYDMINRMNLVSCKFDSFYKISLSNDSKMIAIGSGNGNIYLLGNKIIVM